jgi:hypothetical protein
MRSGFATPLTSAQPYTRRELETLAKSLYLERMGRVAIPSFTITPFEDLPHRSREHTLNIARAYLESRTSQPFQFPHHNLHGRG